MSDLSTLTDSQLYKKCKEYGQKAKLWKQRFAGLLPEVEKRLLYKKRGFTSLHEFAAKLAGMSHSSVDRILKVSEKLADKPKLKEELTSGKIHWSKLEKVAYVATPETEAEWIKKVHLLPRPALEIAVREARGGLPIPEDESENLNTITFYVTPEVEKQLRLLKNQMEKQAKHTLSWNDAFKKFFQDGLDSEKVVAIVCPECAKRKGENPEGKRHIPVETKRMVEAMHGKTCVFRGCKKPAVTLHHTRRFTLNPSHDPEFIVPLCQAHNLFVHAGLVEDELIPAQKWKTLSQADPKHPKFAVDQKVQKFWSG